MNEECMLMKYNKKYWIAEIVFSLLSNTFHDISITFNYSSIVFHCFAKFVSDLPHDCLCSLFIFESLIRFFPDSSRFFPFWVRVLCSFVHDYLLLLSLNMKWVSVCAFMCSLLSFAIFCLVSKNSDTSIFVIMGIFLYDDMYMMCVAFYFILILFSLPINRFVFCAGSFSWALSSASQRNFSSYNIKSQELNGRICDLGMRDGWNIIFIRIIIVQCLQINFIMGNWVIFSHCWVYKKQQSARHTLSASEREIKNENQQQQLQMKARTERNANFVAGNTITTG